MKQLVSVRRRPRGFTLVELMIVVAIIGLLASIAVPSFMKYLAKAKSAEADQMLEKIATGARAYFMDQHVGHDIDGATLSQRFPASTALSPALSCCQPNQDKCAPRASAWDNPSWQSLNFSVDDPHYYRYEYESLGTGAAAEFTARAYGDLDCDNVLSTFERYGWVELAGNDMSVQSGTYKEKRFE